MPSLFWLKATNMRVVSYDTWAYEKLEAKKQQKPFFNSSCQFGHQTATWVLSNLDHKNWRMWDKKRCLVRKISRKQPGKSAGRAFSDTSPWQSCQIFPSWIDGGGDRSSRRSHLSLGNFWRLTFEVLEGDDRWWSDMFPGQTLAGQGGLYIYIYIHDYHIIHMISYLHYFFLPAFPGFWQVISYRNSMMRWKMWTKARWFVDSTSGDLCRSWNAGYAPKRDPVVVNHLTLQAKVLSSEVSLVFYRHVLEKTEVDGGCFPSVLCSSRGMRPGACGPFWWCRSDWKSWKFEGFDYYVVCIFTKNYAHI